MQTSDLLKKEVFPQTILPQHRVRTSIGIVVPTKDRPSDLRELFSTILTQSSPPVEVIIVDDSVGTGVKELVEVFVPAVASIGSKLTYVRGPGFGLTAARNLGVKVCTADAILFLDDDTLLDNDVVKALAIFLADNPIAKAIQPKVISVKADSRSSLLDKAIYVAFMLSYNDGNVLKVRNSGMSIYPSYLTKVISTTRLSGCCFCVRKDVFRQMRFDTNLLRVGSMEDLDFSFRLYKMYPQSLYALPYVKVIHKASAEARLPSEFTINMITVYWFYVFFKNSLQSSIVNLFAFLWAQIGTIVTTTAGLVIKKKKRVEWWTLIYLVRSYMLSLGNLKKILSNDLSFFNNRLGKVR